MIVAVIVGARKRAGTKGVHESMRANQEQQAVSDRFLLQQLVGNLLNKYKQELAILSYACDDGVGKIIKEICAQRDIKAGELTWYFHGDKRWETGESGRCYLARTATMLEIGDLFVVLPDNTRQGLVENLIERLKLLQTLEEHGKPSELQARPFAIIDEKGKVIDSFKSASIL